LWQGQWRQPPDFADSRIAQQNWLAIKRRLKGAEKNCERWCTALSYKRTVCGGAPGHQLSARAPFLSMSPSS